QGTMTFVAVASSALGPVVFSLARDSTGTYEQAAMILALLPITVALAAAVLRPARIPRPD
ncbi:MAG: MFS transporter, partial [Acidimicrobiia bacterium]|nr:MFS transporter [Acidimicrobiia bacterium]